MPPPPASAPPAVSAETFAILFRAHFAQVRRMVRRTGVPEADAGDVSQEVFLALHVAIGRGLNLAAPLRGWLRRTTYRIARDRLKLACNARELVTTEGEIDAVDEGQTPEGTMEAIDARRIVEELLDQIPAEQRIVLVMSDVEEMPMSEIAEVMEIPAGTGYTRLRTARAAFEAAWNRRRAEAPRAAVYGLSPLLLLDARSLLEAERPIPDAPAGFEDDAWRRLVHALGPGLGGAAAGGAAAAAKGAAVALTAPQIAIGLLLAALAGAGLHAALGGAKASAPVAIAAEDPRAAAAGAPVMLSEDSPPPTASASGARASIEADAGAPMDPEASERYLINRAHAALGRAEQAPDDRTRDREIATVFAALEEHDRRFPRPRFATERDAIRRQALAYQQRRMEDGGQP
jgi:RNA polymerase sigma-70 factor, ECF subfamily